MPVTALRSDAQAQFRELREAFRAATPEQRLQLETSLREFLFAYPHEDTGRLARGYLAWILIQKGQLAEAAHIVDELSRGRAGVARDFASLLEATLMLKHGRPHEALKVLRPLQGKLLDPVEQFLVTEQLVMAALDATLYSEAIASMADWITQAGVLRRDAVREAALSRLRLIPRRYLERALEAPPVLNNETDEARAKSKQQQWVYESVSRLLVDLAIADQDTQLARRILELNPAALGVGEEATELVRLATNGQASAQTVGRSFGLVLSTREPVARRRSIEVAEAIAITLRLATRDDSQNSVHLLLREAERLEDAMSDLANHGAGVIVAGVTEQDANLAASYAEQNRLPVVLLTPAVLDTPYAFEVGLSELDERTFLTSSVEAGTPYQVVTREDCEQLPASVNESRFALQNWQEEGTMAVVILTDAPCTRLLLSDMRRAKFQPLCLFGLDSTSLPDAQVGHNRSRIRAHRFPMERGAAKDVDELIQELGHAPSWFETLGRDTAVILQELLSRVHVQGSSSAKDVENVRELLLRGLRSVHHSDLWSTGDARFDSSRQLTRKLTLESTTTHRH